MRTKYFLSRDHPKIAVQGLNVDRFMGCVLNGVYEAQSANLMGGSDDFSQGIDRFNSVRGISEGNPLCALV
jgi:hypothetical protein